MGWKVSWKVRGGSKVKALGRQRGPKKWVRGQGGWKGRTT